GTYYLAAQQASVQISPVKLSVAISTLKRYSYPAAQDEAR
ncbi:hypothetical protein SAMN05216338_10321, partial [Bradyrhizobium sp. Rc2d]